MRLRCAGSMGVLVLSQCFLACSSSSSDTPGTPIELRGDYGSSGGGPIREINFVDDTHYLLWRSPCAEGEQPEPGSDRCRESGAYALNEARTELSLTNAETGETKKMPFRSLGAKTSMVDGSHTGSALHPQSGGLTNDGGVSLVQKPVSLASSFEAGAQQFQRGVYVALGDSYASGLGTRQYTDDGCKRSDFAYAKLIADARGYELKHVACQGDKIPQVEGQLSALSSDTTLVTLSVGGNDTGFSDVITQCAKPAPWDCWDDINGATRFINNELEGKLDGLYKNIRSKAPNARVFIIGYPKLLSGRECNFIAHISNGEQTQLNNVANRLSAKIESVARSNGFEYIDAREAFKDHAVCADQEWINGTAFTVDESFHPNRDGHRGYKELIVPKL
ncbi:SGNH/GDSL hydrolase family protein [Pendulispora albinea]|uniref:SGNH/GDSL hydrolase family protein n=1 Tax=Pendulispora albinea TaxID=2741071 RepID=A0ABZ2LLL3_9BACT